MLDVEKSRNAVLWKRVEIETVETVRRPLYCTATVCTVVVSVDVRLSESGQSRQREMSSMRRMKNFTLRSAFFVISGSHSQSPRPCGKNIKTKQELENCCRGLINMKSQYFERMKISENNSGQSRRSATLGRNQSNEVMNFDPEKSNRETRKMARKSYTEHKRKQVLYDANGINLETGKDACDCLVPNCAGCHFPCPRCRSLKCGHECRQHRRAQYEPGIISEKMNWTKQVESVEDDDDDVTAIN